MATAPDAALTLGSTPATDPAPDTHSNKDPKDGLYGSLGLDSPQGLYNKKKNKKAPKAPSYTDIINADKASSAFWEQTSRDMLDWAKQNDMFTHSVLTDTLGMQQHVFDQTYAAAQADRKRYDENYVPAVDDLVKRFNAYDTVGRREADAARAMADVNTSYEAQRQQALQTLEGYGIDPSQTRFAALDSTLRAKQAADAAMAGNEARRQTELTGLTLRAQGVDLLGKGSGLADQANTEAGTAANIAGAMTGEANAQADTAGRGYALPIAFGGLAQTARDAAGNTINTQYQNKLQEAGFKNLMQQQAQANTGSTLGAIGGIIGGMYGGPAGAAAGQAAGSYIGSGAKGGDMSVQKGGHAGGMVPGDLSAIPHPSDTVAANLEPGEYVVPANVVRMKGREFFDRLTKKYDPGNTRVNPEPARGRNIR